MKYSDYIHESEINHKSLSYNLLTPKVAKGKSLKPQKIKVSPSKALSLLAPYTISRIMEQIKAVVPLAAYLFLFLLHPLFLFLFFQHRKQVNQFYLKLV